MQQIPRIRFDALAAYCRAPQHVLTGKELRWFSFDNERVLATLIRDTIDGDYGGILLARDEMKRYRCEDTTAFFDSTDAARAAIKEQAHHLLAALDKQAKPAEQLPPIDFFAFAHPPEKLHPSFVQLADLEGYSPAHGVIEPMMRWYEDADGNFVEQFQTTGFDARIWELYLFAMFVEIGYSIDRSIAVPDFICRGIFGEFCVEATSVNPSVDAKGNLIPPPPIDTLEQMMAFQREYMPIRYSQPLTNKLAKQYWQHPHVAGKPLLFAIQDFHAPGSMRHTRTALPIYLYGYYHDWHKANDGTLTVIPIKITEHQWENKKVPSGFFNLPGAENVSAVIYNNGATISKFNRMGVLAGFGSERVRLTRYGEAVVPDPNAVEPESFVRVVNEAGYKETWVEGLDVYHNPHAKFPLDPALMPQATHHRVLEDGNVESLFSGWRPLQSTTVIEIIE
jgi:hypothetical protein